MRAVAVLMLTAAALCACSPSTPPRAVTVVMQPDCTMTLNDKPISREDVDQLVAEQAKGEIRLGIFDPPTDPNKHHRKCVVKTGLPGTERR